MGGKRLQLGGEDEAFADAAVIERLFPEPVARQHQRTLAAIPQREREHSSGTFQRARKSPARNGFEQDFGVGMTPPGVRRLGVQPAADLLVIVDLAVEDHDVALACRKHRLVAGGRQIDDRQPPLRQRDAGLGIRPHAVIVRPAMPEQIGHPPHQGGILPCRSCAAEKTCNSTHEGSIAYRGAIAQPEDAETRSWGTRAR